MKILITGTNSGLGKHFFEIFGGIIWNRDISENTKRKLKQTGVDVILHAAFNSSKQITSDNLFAYLQDNIWLTMELLSIPHKKFVFISSIDVYPKNNQTHSEEEIIDVNAVSGMYAITKPISESLVKKQV